MKPSPPLPPPLDAQRFSFDGINAYMAGQGPPLLLVHSVNAAASAAEIRPLFDRWRGSRTVFAIDLPGYGLSDRGDRDYTPRLMTDALHATADQIRLRCGPGAIDALALSLGCEFLARAAAERPDVWRRLTLVSPTGFRGTRQLRGPAGSTRGAPWVYRLLNAPLWSQGLFDLLTRPAVVRYFLQRTWGSRDIDETLWAYCVRTAAQPGARHAPLHFLSGGLFSADIHSVYEALTQPVWMVHGTRGDFTDYRGATLVAGRANWHISVYRDTGALMYFEQPARFCAELEAFLEG
jgi:pimeloyl-ACP methyl ester carboxylesterase